MTRSNTTLNQSLRLQLVSSNFKIPTRAGVRGLNMGPAVLPPPARNTASGSVLRKFRPCVQEWARLELTPRPKNAQTKNAMVQNKTSDFFLVYRTEQLFTILLSGSFSRRALGKMVRVGQLQRDLQPRHPHQNEAVYRSTSEKRRV